MLDTRRNFIWFAAGAIALLLVVVFGGLIFLKTGAGGFSARAQPSFLETFAAGEARSLAMPSSAKDRPNPVAKSQEVLEEGMAHWADHCALCHGNNGSGEVDMGRQMYPHAPDMRKERTQKLTDGELFYIIENGIRLSGMPGWGGASQEAHGATDSWKLVHFIRHLPDLTPAETARMEKLNPKGPDERDEERKEEDFLNNKGK